MHFFPVAKSSCCAQLIKIHHHSKRKGIKVCLSCKPAYRLYKHKRNSTIILTVKFLLIQQTPRNIRRVIIPIIGGKMKFINAPNSKVDISTVTAIINEPTTEQSNRPIPSGLKFLVSTFGVFFKLKL